MTFQYVPDPPPFDIDQKVSEWVQRELQRISDDLQYSGIPNFKFASPTNINKTAGGTEVGGLSDVLSLNDGNVYNLPEASGTPGFRVEFDFVNITDIPKGLVFNGYYSPTSAHPDVIIEIRNYSTSTDDQLIQLSPAASANYRTILFSDGENYVDSSNNSQFIIDHVTSGNPAHDLYVDYIALLY